MRVVVIGFGSIGKRHVNNLISQGITDIILFREHSKGNTKGLKEINNCEEILDLKPDFVLVSNPTYLHYKKLIFLIEKQINILCEKPLVSSKEDWGRLKTALTNYQGYAKVVFNLRYHPCIIKVKEILDQNFIGKVNYARFFVGQYLPDWRPNTNHLESYSAKKEYGGGVVLDLVHEIDLAEYLINEPEGEIKSIVSRVSDVTIDTEDIAELIYKTRNNEIVNIHLDYLYRGYSRNFTICGEKMNIYCDLFENTVQIIGNHNHIIKSFEFLDFERNDMYNNLLKDYVRGLKNPKLKTNLPSFEENKSVLMTCFKIINK